jgi:hypothetical protein
MQGVRDKIGLYLGLFRAGGWHFLQLRKRSLSRLVSSVQAGSTPSSRGLPQKVLCDHGSTRQTELS